MIFTICILFLPSLFALISISNQFFLIRLRDQEKIFPSSITILLPVRDEERNVSALIGSLRNQRGLPKFHVILIDDNSTDHTKDLCREAIADDLRFSLLEGEPLPNGWHGKPFALQQGFDLSESEYVLLLDADVRLKPGAIAEAAGVLKERNLDYLSAYPREIALSWSERLIQPLLQWSWLTTVPLAVAQKSSNPAFAVANGQFFLIRSDALLRIGGFNSIRNSVIDDLSLARALIRNGFHGAVADGSAIAECRMYQSWSELEDGYGKSLPIIFGEFFGSISALLLLFVTGVLPLILTLADSSAGLIALTLMYVSRILSVISTRGRYLDFIAHPLSSLLLIYLILRAWQRRGKVLWKGRAV